MAYGQILLVFLLLLLVNLSNGQQIKKQGYSIDGTIKGLDSGIVRMLSRSGSHVLDSSVIERGKFFLQGKIGSPQQVLFQIAPGNWSFLAFVEDTPIRLFVDTAGAEHHGNDAGKWALIWNVEQTGSQLADVYKKYTQETKQRYFVSLFSTLQQKLEAVKGNTDAETALKQKMDSIVNVLCTKQKAWMENYIRHHPSSIAGVFLLHNYYQTAYSVPLPYLDSLLNRFSGAAKTSLYFKELADIVRKLKNRQPNSQAPDFTLLQADKSPFTLSSTRGNYVLIDFWASWCVPCRKAIPAWKELYALYKNKGLIIIGVSNDRNWDDWIRALHEEQMPWVQVIDHFPAAGEGAVVADLYAIEGLPFYVLLDKEGKVLLASGSKDDVLKKIETIFR